MQCNPIPSNPILFNPIQWLLYIRYWTAHRVWIDAEVLPVKPSQPSKCLLLSAITFSECKGLNGYTYVATALHDFSELDFYQVGLTLCPFSSHSNCLGLKSTHIYVQQTLAISSASEIMSINHTPHTY